MTDKSIPVSSPRDTDNSEIEDWYLPEFEETVSEDTNALGMKTDWFEERRIAIAEEEEYIEPQPLTAEDIETIRQAAYDDGYNEGKNQGYIDGLEAGNAEGLAKGEEEGKLQGLTQGLEQGQCMIAEKAKAWEGLQTEMHMPLAEVSAEVELELVRVAMGLAEEVIKTEVTFNTDILLQTLKLAIDALPIKEQKISITLNPADLAVISEYYPAEECEKRHWLLISEPMMKQGNLQINNELSSVELIMEQRIKQLMRRFLAENKPSEA